MIAQTPALRARLLEQRDGWRAALAQEVATRTPSTRNELGRELPSTGAVGALQHLLQAPAREFR